MKNFNQLEREKKEVLLKLDKEEIIAYFDNISKKQLETYPKLTKQGITDFDYEEFDRLEEILQDSIKILNSKYRNIGTLPFISKFIELNNVYDENIKESKVLLLTKELVIITNTVKNIAKGLNLLQEHLTFYYFRYFFRFSNILEDLEIANVPDKALFEVQDSLFKDEFNPKFFNTTFELGYDYLLELIITDLEENVQKFKKFNQFKENPEEVLSDKDVPEEIVELYSLIYSMFCFGNAFIEDYEELKANPFKEGLELVIINHLEVILDESISDLDSFEESLTDEKDIEFFNLFKDKCSLDVPKYDFKEFKLILPESVEAK